MCSGHRPPPRRRAAKAHRAPRQTRCSSGGLGKSAAVRNETQRSLVVNMRILHWNDNPDSLTRDLFSLESEPISNPKIFPAPESELPSTPSSARAKSRWWTATRARSTTGCDELWIQGDPAPRTRVEITNTQNLLSCRYCGRIGNQHPSFSERSGFLKPRQLPTG